jgi:hypothetical protein
MLNHRTTRKTGNLGWVLAVLWVCRAAYAGEIQFSAEVDQNQISADDTVALKLMIQASSSGMAGEPQFDAPDFEVVNDFSSISVSSQYDSNAGRFTMINSQQITKVLRPLKTGNLRIANIRLKNGGKLYTIPDIAIQVFQPGSGGAVRSQNSRGAARGGAVRINPMGNAGGNNTANNGGNANRPAAVAAIVKAEIEKNTAYKGEQIIVSYYLYHQSKIFNIQVDKFPILNGFLREDLEMPVMGQRLDSEKVVRNGVNYERSLLARYAAYPLEEGKLTIDSLSLKFNYYANARSSNFDEEDPFFGFFQQLSPRVGTALSELLPVQVSAIPTQGRPESFSGGIGDFTLSSAIDKYDVHANEAVTLTVKVEGRGNVASIQEPKNKWPDNVELYDSKGRAKSGRGGVGEKVFEFLLIPRVPGKLDLPALEFGFFDPNLKKYYTKSTLPLTLNVLDPAPGTALVPVSRKNPGKALNQSALSPKVEDVRYLKPPVDMPDGIFGQPIWRILYWICLVLATTLFGFIASDLLRRNKKRVERRRRAQTAGKSKTWDRLHASARGATNGAPWQEVTQAYEVLTGVLFDTLDSAFNVGVRSISRPQLRQILVDEKGMPQEVWGKAESLLEFADLVRFASSAGAVSENQARSELLKWVGEGESFVKKIETAEN